MSTPDVERNSGKDKPLIPEYELLHVIGAGSYGEVWMARNLFGHLRAIKVVRRSAFSDKKPFDREFNGLKQFEPISHSHEAFVHILQVGRSADDEFFYSVMELADDNSGEVNFDPAQYSPKTGASVIDSRGHLPVPEVIRIGMNLTGGLGCLHANGLVHRDIKPANIIFIKGVPKLADIGLVHTIENAASMVGTQGYIPPEGPGTIQADIFSLGKVLYELSTGNDRQQFPELPDFVLNSSDPGLLTELNEFLFKSCHSERSQRYQSAEAMLSDLRILEAGQSLSRLHQLERRWARLRRTLIASVSLLLLLGGLGWFFYIQHASARSARSAQHLTALNYGARLIEEGHYFQSLPWYANALRLVEPEAPESLSARVTMSTLLRSSPRLVNCWWQTNKVTCAQYSPDGHHIVFSQHNGQVAVIDALTGKRQLELWHAKDTSAIYAVFSPKADKLATIGDDFVARVWSFPEGRLLNELPHSAALHTAEFNRAGDRLLVSADGKILQLWDLDTSLVRRAYQGHGYTVWSASFNEDETRIISASGDKTAKVWNVETGEILLSIPHKSWVFSATYSPDGKSIATVGFDRTLRIWDAEDGRPTSPVMKHTAAPCSVQFRPDGRQVVTATYDTSVHLWDIRSGTLASSVLRHGANVDFARFSPDGRFVLNGSWDGTLRVWDASPWLPEPVPERFSEDGSLGFLIETNRIVVREPGEKTWSLQTDYPVRTVLSSKNGERFIVLPTNSTAAAVRGYDRKSSERFTLALAPSSSKTLWSLAPHAPLVACYVQSNIMVWNYHRQSTPMIWTAPTGGAALALSPRGDYLAFGAGKDVHILATATGQEHLPPIPHNLPASCLSFSPDGKRLATGCADNSLTEGYASVWDLNSGAEISPRFFHGDGVVCVAFSPDGRYLATGGEDFVAKIWLLKDGQKLPPLRHTDQIRSLMFSPDSRWLITGSWDLTARVWDVATATPITPALKHPVPFHFAGLTRNQRGLFTLGDDGTSRVWDLTPETNHLDQLSIVAEFLAGNSPSTTPEEQRTIRTLLNPYRPKER